MPLETDYVCLQCEHCLWNNLTLAYDVSDFSFSPGSCFFFAICFFNYLLIHGFHIMYPFLQIPSLADPACSDLSLCATLFYFSLPLYYAKTSVDPQWAILSKSLIYLPIKMSVYFVDMDGKVAMVYLLFDWFWISEFGCSLYFPGSSIV